MRSSSFDSGIPAAQGRTPARELPFAKDLQRNAAAKGRLYEVRNGARAMRPKARGRKQGTGAKLCPLRLNTTEGAFKKEAQ